MSLDLTPVARLEPSYDRGMHASLRHVRPEDGRAKNFDVICAGEALFAVSPLGAGPHGAFVPAGGAVNLALALAREGLRVGLATVLADDDFGRRCLDRMAASRVDVGGVGLARPRAGLVLVDASGGERTPQWPGGNDPAFEVPSGWSSPLLLLSGLSPALSYAAALCRAARAARRAGALVVLDFNASLHAWAGQDPRTIRMLLREVDVARCSVADLAVLGMDVRAVRVELRPEAVTVVSAPDGSASATGPFGEVTFAPPPADLPRPSGSGGAFTAALCAELTRLGEPGESAQSRWRRALARGHAAVLARARMAKALRR